MKTPTRPSAHGLNRTLRTDLKGLFRAWIFGVVVLFSGTSQLIAQTDVEFQNSADCPFWVDVFFMENICPGGGPGGQAIVCQLILGNASALFPIPPGYVVRRVRVYCDHSCNPIVADLDCTQLTATFNCDGCSAGKISGDFVNALFRIY
jgi:hypothetical protein